MHFAAFQKYFPELADAETRFFQIVKASDLPADTYYLEEMYCEDPNCDCRRVLFFVFPESEPKMLAAIGFGWEGEKFYARQTAGYAMQKPETRKGPFLDEKYPQSEYASAILDVVASDILSDKAYVKRLKKHYQMTRKAAADQRAGRDANPVSIKEKVGRNEPCPCGSGKKYKKCCMG